MEPVKKGVNFCVIKVIDGEPCILLQKRDDNTTNNPLEWCVPGGGREEDETLAETAARELREEYGVTVPLEKWHQLGDRAANEQGEVAGEYFAAFIDEASEVPTDHEVEGENYQWHSINKIHRLDLGFGQNESLVEMLQEFVMSYSEYDEPMKEFTRFH